MTSKHLITALGLLLATASPSFAAGEDHDQPVDVSKASAKLTLLSGTEKQDVELKPAGNKLEATGSFKVGPGTKAVAVVSLAGKPLGTARFTVK